MGWGLVALVSAGNLAVTMLAAFLNLAVWAVGPTEGQVPFVFEAYRVLCVVFAGLWVALLAFWLGLARRARGRGTGAADVGISGAIRPVPCSVQSKSKRASPRENWRTSPQR